MPKTENIPLVQVLIHRKGQTTSVRNVPEYEARLLQEVWAIPVSQNKATVEVRELKKPLFIQSEFETERSRLAGAYKRHPMDKNDALFSRVYPGLSFDDAWDRVLGKAVAATKPQEIVTKEDIPAPPEQAIAENKSLLAAVRGLNDELAEAIENQFGIYTVDELATIDKDKLVEIAGIGPKSAEGILASAQELALQGANQPGE